MSTPPAIAVFEFESIAIGTRAADAMVKKAAIDLFRVGTVQPGKHLVMIGGSVAAVEESRIEGLRVGAEALIQEISSPTPTNRSFRLSAARGRPTRATRWASSRLPRFPRPWLPPIAP